MFDVRLAQLPNLTPWQKAVFKRAGLTTPSEVLLPPRDALLKTLKPLPKTDVDQLVEAVAHGICPHPTRLGGLKQEHEGEGTSPVASGSGGGTRTREESVDILCFGDGEIDKLLGGGVRKGMITEIVGESSAGKSQFCLLLALSSQLSSLQHRPSPNSSTSSSQYESPSAGPSSPHPQSHATSSSSPLSPPPPPPPPPPPQTFQSLGSVAYLSSEGKHPSHAARLRSLAAGLLARYPQDPSLGISIESLTSNILFDDCHDVEALDHTISYRIPALIARLNPPSPPKPSPPSVGDFKGKGKAQPPTPPPPLHLIVLDSLAALIRTSFPTNSSSGLSLRSAALCSLSDKLKSLAVLHNLAIVVVNQVTDVFYSPWRSFDDLYTSGAAEGDGGGGPVELGYKDQARWFNGSSKELGKEASLGLAWVNCVNTRVMLSRTERYRRVEVMGSQQLEREPSLVRRIEVVFGTGMARGRRDYVVWGEGIFGLKPPKDAGARRRSLKRGREEEELGEDASRETEAMFRSQSQAGGLDEVDLEAAAVEGGLEGGDDEYGDDAWINGLGEEELKGSGAW